MLNQLVADPFTLDHFTVEAMERALAIDHVLFELANVFLAIHKEQGTETLFEVLDELTLEAIPVIFELIKVCVVKWTLMV